MRQIGTLKDEHDAVRFGDYLLTLGVKNSVEQTQGGDWAVWVEDDDQLARGAAELETFRANPTDGKYDEARDHAEAHRAEEDRRAQRRRKQFVDVRTGWTHSRQWNVPLTLTLIILSLVVGIYSRVWESHGGPDEPAIINWLRIAPVTFTNDAIQWYGLSAIEHGQVWRLVTPIFLHGGVLHLLFNMIWLRDLGALIESRRGTLFMAVLVIASAMLSNLAQYRMSGPLFLGMSGVVYALFGFAWIKGKVDPNSGCVLHPQVVGLMLVWLVVCMIGIVGPVANTAHVVGMIVGMAFAAIPHGVRRMMRR
jgi:GlpG protein